MLATLIILSKTFKDIFINENCSKIHDLYKAVILLSL